MTTTDEQKRNTGRVLAAFLIALMAGCGEDASFGVAADGKPGIGDVDPNAPPGWPLRIGDADFVEWGMPGGVTDRYDETWLGNCCINVVDGVRYTAKFGIGDRNGKSYSIYEGHVRAEPVWWRLRMYREWISPEEWEAIKTYPDWEERMKPVVVRSEAEAS